MHYDRMIALSFGSIIDNGYGPINVYDNMDKSLARVNANSYAYYALVSLESVSRFRKELTKCHVL
jgi:hypothetical protein